MSPTNSRPIHRWLSLVPGAAIVLFAATSDVRQGRELIDDWGTGQSILVVIGIAVAVLGHLIHRKAVNDENNGKRRYSRTIAFIVIPTAVMIGVPCILAETAARLFHEPPAHGSSYHQTDPELGIVLAPNRQYQVSSIAKDFDIRVQVDESGFRFVDSPVAIETADILVVGDSHAFGLGVAQDQTLAAHLTRLVRIDDQSARVVNAGVPGYGPLQSILRAESYVGQLPEDATVVLFINPINDLINLSRDVDYRYPKPFGSIANDRLVVHPPPTDADGVPYRFSPDFEFLNKLFAPTDPSKWYESVFMRWLSGTDIPPESPTVEGVTMMRDETTEKRFLQDDARRIFDSPARYAARFWPEMSELETQRQTLLKLADAVLERAKQSSINAGWKLIVVLAPEAHHYQPYSKRYAEQVDAAWPQGNIELGWSRDKLRNVCREKSILTVTLDESEVDPERSFVRNDDHTSGYGLEQIAKKLASVLKDSRRIEYDFERP